MQNIILTGASDGLGSQFGQLCKKMISMLLHYLEQNLNMIVILYQ